MHGVKRLFAWMIPRFDRQRASTCRSSACGARTFPKTRSSSSASTSPISGGTSSIPGPTASPARVEEQARRRRAHARLRGDDVRAAVRVAPGDSGDAARARQPHRHAVVSEGRRPAAGAAHRPGDCGVGIDGGIHDSRAPDAGGADQGGVSRLAAGRICPRCGSAEEIAAARAALGIDAVDHRRRHGDAADAVEGQPVSRRGGARDHRSVSRKRACLHRRRRASSSRSSRRRRGRSASATASSSSASSATSPRCSQRSTSWCFRRLWEGTPLTAFEALAAGKPIVATDADGLLDILTDRQDALVVPKRNAGALARAVIRRDRAARPGRAAWREARRTGRALRHRARSCARWSACTRLLHETSRATRRAGVLSADLGFLTAHE